MMMSISEFGSLGLRSAAEAASALDRQGRVFTSGGLLLEITERPERILIFPKRIS